MGYASLSTTLEILTKENFECEYTTRRPFRGRRAGVEAVKNSLHTFTVFTGYSLTTLYVMSRLAYNPDS